MRGGDGACAARCRFARGTLGYCIPKTLKARAKKKKTKKKKKNKMGGGDDETVECDVCCMEVRVASCALVVVRGDILCAACAACELGRTMRASLHI